MKAWSPVLFGNTVREHVLTEGHEQIAQCQPGFKTIVTIDAHRSERACPTPATSDYTMG